MTDDKSKSKVALFVDFDHLKRHTEGGPSPVCSLSSAVEAIWHRVRELGTVAVANVYADWESLPGQQSEVKRLHLDPRFVFSEQGPSALNVARTNGSVLTLALDVMEHLFERDDIQMYVLVSGDAGVIDLLGRIKARGGASMLIGFERSIGEELADSAEHFEAIESYVQTGDLLSEDTPPSPEDFEPTSDDDFNWEPFILLLNRLETNLPFISLKYLKNQVLTPAHGCDNTLESKGNLIREAIRMNFIETAKVPNPRNPNFDTTTCRLNRRHPEVRRVLGA